MFQRHPDSCTFTETHWFTVWISFRRVQDLDLRVFEDAITFKIAMMVVKYMNYMETFDY